MNKFLISNKLISFNKINSLNKIPGLITELKEGKSIAIVVMQECQEYVIQVKT